MKRTALLTAAVLSLASVALFATACNNDASAQPLAGLLSLGQSGTARPADAEGADGDLDPMGLGGPGHHGPRGPGQGLLASGLYVGPPLFARLNLTDGQVDQADEIFHQAHVDIRTLQRSARDQIRALLTEEQLAKLDALRENGPRALGIRPPAFPPQSGSNPIADYLGLSDEQKAQIEPIRTATHDQIEARHTQARDAFRAILTPEQQQELDEIRDGRP